MSSLAAARRPFGRPLTRAYRQEDWLVLAVGLALYLAGVWLVNMVLHATAVDAMARMVHASLTLFGAEPKLTSIGFFWPPLPTLLQLPFTLVPFLRDNGLTGPLVTALSSAGTLVMLNAFFRLQGLGRWLRGLLLVAFAANPLIFYYAVNGMSEMVMAFFLLAACYCFLAWQRTDRWIYLAGLGTALGLGFLTRYETVLLAGLFGLGLLAHGLRQGRAGLRPTEAALLAYGAPVGYAVFLWLLSNWVIVGNPLNFATGPYGTTTFTRLYLLEQPGLLPLRTNLLAVVLTVLERSWLAFPAYLPLVGVLLALSLLRRRLDLFTWAVLLGSFFASGVLNFMVGFPLVYVRYYLLLIPSSFVAAALIWRELRHRRVAGAMLVLAVGASAFVTARTLDHPTELEAKGPEKYFIAAMQGAANPDFQAPERAMADYIVQHAGRREVLGDTSGGSDIMFFAGRPWLFVVPGDTDYDQVLRAPFGQVEYILVPEGIYNREINSVLMEYPLLLETGAADWATLEYATPGWRLFRLTAQPGTAPLAAANDRLAPP